VQGFACPGCDNGNVQLETRYAGCGNVHVAFQVCGRGRVDLLFIPGLISHLDLEWEDTAYRSFILQLSRTARVVRFDKRGTGLSDPVDSLPTMRQRCADAFAVLDAVGSTSVVAFGHCEGGPIALRMAARRPGLVRALVLYGTGARATPPDVVTQICQAIECWGSGATLDMFAPSIAADPIARSARGRLERAAASPALARATFAALADADAQSVLPRIRVPTLVLHRRHETVPIGEGRFLAERIQGAEFVEIDGADHLPWVGDTQPVLDAVSRFLARLDLGLAAAPDRPSAPSRRKARALTGVASLTERENEVAELVARGMSNPEISRHLYLSRYTVESHLKSISAKLGVQGRAKVIAAIRGHKNP
jgi:pimeloyl-ACP methyl ester carboxylesterase/DNA-binding CsgD family transcriptional regulator